MRNTQASIRFDPARRRNHCDVTDRVRTSHPADVLRAVSRILQVRYPGIQLEALRHAFSTFGRLYAGWLPGYLGCDTWYHDAQHSLDCALTMARLMDGHDRSVAEPSRLGPRRAVLGVIIALFHDAGYIRHAGDDAANGAEFTLTHVKRSGDFLEEFLPHTGYAAEAGLASQLVHFTGWEIALDRIAVVEPLERTLGFMLGTADVLAQTADRCYLEKCRDYLFREFEICGLAGMSGTASGQPAYETPEHLLMGTPEFNHKLWQERLDGYFGSVHRYLDAHFNGINPYRLSIDANMARIQEMINSGSFAGLTRRPQVIGAHQLRRILGRIERLKPVLDASPRQRPVGPRAKAA
jgi:hypothetical protein